MNFVAKLAVGMGTVLLVSGMTLSPATFAQQGGGAPTTNQQVNAMQNQMDDLTDVQRQTGIDPAQRNAYKKFFSVSSSDPDQKIKLGTEFCKKYPTSPFTEAVDAGLTSAYFEKQDWKNFYAYADKALALNPDEVDVLTTVGWVIPHQYDPNAPGAAQQLQTAEADEKHALDLLAKMPKPKGISDQVFAATKAQKSQQAHSALGLIYFRRGDYTNSASELQQSTQAAAAPDPTDLYVLGVDLQNLNRHAEAAKAFTRCSQIAGPLQDRCKQSGDKEGHQAGGAQ
ncbi:MAG: hypothetical protein ACRD4R_13805 [Candidatus Acidiferrales bacterium]